MPAIAQPPLTFGYRRLAPATSPDIRATAKREGDSPAVDGTDPHGWVFGVGMGRMLQAIAQAHLEQAGRHIEAAQARLAWLEEVILDEQGRGLDTSLAETLMHNVMATLCMMVRHRLSIRRSLAQAQASGVAGPPGQLFQIAPASGASNSAPDAMCAAEPVGAPALARDIVPIA
jgi:hypothetical protein